MAILVALGVLVFVGAFIWAALRPPVAMQTSAAGDAPTASASETLSDGRLDVQVFALGNRDVRLEIKFMPDVGAIETASIRPNVNFAMVEMHMDGFEPPLQLVESGIWRANLKLPMEGRWVVSVGFGDEFAEIEFDAK
ncbi:MAG: hypothetical protein DI533_06360 [Cereibacter sphaeroides]|uniref:YtkA-like domain-containing protein n=1 Tax=Cereibacter sphaeroides TaxID=1063 RepID=A0A2W5SHB2_CERSP|nr:MAG: hypothetical protein DI533_06360 [Cereibacter sphaeroides]